MFSKIFTRSVLIHCRLLLTNSKQSPVEMPPVPQPAKQLLASYRSTKFIPQLRDTYNGTYLKTIELKPTTSHLINFGQNLYHPLIYLCLQSDILLSCSPNRTQYAIYTETNLQNTILRWDIPVCGEYNQIHLTVKHTRNKIKY